MEKKIDKIIKFLRSGDLAGSFAEGCECADCDKYEKKIRKKLEKLLT